MLRNFTAELGGNLVVLDTNNQDGGWVTMTGRAFKCK
jgi:hypothetical protein